jgi:hypothetical protein
LEKKVTKIELTWATVDTDNEEEMTRFEEQELQKAGQRIKKAAQELQDLGIVDEKGRRVKKELPPDMQPGSDADV